MKKKLCPICKAEYREGFYICAHCGVPLVSNLPDGAWFVYVTLGIFFVLWSAFVVASVVIGRNPKKYSKRMIRFFFQDGYTH